MKPPVKIVIIYLVIGSLWILLSDRLVLALFSDDITSLSHFQTLKGMFYVVSTALLLFFLVRHYYREIDKRVDDLEVLNEKLKQQSAQLEATNKNLEQFAYSASHDLQEPLRMVTSFISLLEKKYAAQLDEKAREYIFFAVDGAHRMRQVILDILEFSRVGKHVEQMTLIALDDVLNEVCQLQSQLIHEKQGIVHHHDLPTIRTYRTPLVQILQNLISNAMKYHKSGESPQVWITVKEQAAEWQIAVKDNGIGIDAEYFETIFGIFKRLHSHTQVKGTGMGLAIVRRTVESLGGHIWVESQKGEGSTFYFTLPK